MNSPGLLVNAKPSLEAGLFSDNKAEKGEQVQAANG